MTIDFLNEYKQMVREFINIQPNVLEKYKDDFELYPMNYEIEASGENIINKVYKSITLVKNGLENDEDINKIKEVSINNLDEKEENYARKVKVHDKLQDVFQNVEVQMRKREFNIDWDVLKGYCSRIIEKHTDTIEQNVFEKNENDIILEEVNRYIDEIEQVVKLEKDDKKLEFTDGPVCPTVTDTDEFAKINKQIADDVKEKNENSQNEKTKNEGLSLPDDVLL
jgi:hypothetical protein